MQISGLVVDARTNTPIEDARVTITCETGGGEIAGLLTSRQGRFSFSDVLDERLGEQLVFEVEFPGYRAHRCMRRAERDFAITIPLDPYNEPWYVRLLRRLASLRQWFMDLTRGQRLAMLAALGAALLVYPLWRAFLDGPRPPVCAGSAEAAAATPEVAFAMAEDCLAKGRKNDAVALLIDLRRRGHVPAIHTLGQLYDPRDGAPGRPRQLAPSLVNALDHYRQACELGHPEAASALEGLRPAAQAEADSGGQIATGLLERWPRCP